MNTPADTLLNAEKFQWKGGLPLPNGYEILDPEGNRLMLYWSQDQVQIHMSLATILRNALGKPISDFDSVTASVLMEYLQVADGYFVEPDGESEGP